MQIAATTSPDTAPAAGTERAGLADDFDNFLKILTTQLTNQDPTSPLDPDAFTQQLVQFSAVEQAIKTNSALDDLIGLVQAQQFSRGAELIGTEVEAEGATVRLGPSGEARFQYQLPEAAAGVSLRIRDEAGEVVFRGNGETGAGSHAVAWSGLDERGRRLPEGLYQLEVQAVDASDAPIAAGTTVTGIVDAVETLGERQMLSVNGALVEMGSVRAIRRAATSD